MPGEPLARSASDGRLASGAAILDRMLETERLLLRHLRRADRDDLRLTFGDPEVMRLVGAGRPLSRPEVRAMIDQIGRRFRLDGFGQLGVTRRTDGRLLGRVGLLAVDPATWRAGSRVEIGPTAEIEIGWTLAREAWGRGYATEAATAVRDRARDSLGMRRLVSIIQADNERSLHVAAKLGGHPERRIVTSFGKAPGSTRSP